MPQPSHVTKRDITATLKAIEEKGGKKADNPFLKKLTFEPFSEGYVVTMMHLGPYENEKKTIAKMLEYAEERGYSFAGRHHEIYLSDPNRTAPSKLKTVLRHQVKKTK